MTPRIVGIDSLTAATQHTLDAAAKALRQPAAFYGRYFDPSPKQSPGEYSASEGALLRANNVRVLPIARQTNHVGGAHSLGRSDGIGNAHGIASAIGADRIAEQGGAVACFLDVEGDGLSHLSAEYYLGWCEGLSEGANGLVVEPCVYGIPGDARTWGALREALQRGATCRGVWLSHPYALDYVHTFEPIQWTESMLRPYVLTEVTVVAWQYGFYGIFDASIVNPALADASGFMRTLPLP